ncbi:MULTISPECIES: 2Fe-2S iron-sulfur cluster binding domain-containing protein [Halobacteriovorax]|uniref:2Fe-2S iron-sulfur cluster binding domain-containing protein n=1 Tax=Halobacteriovorax vibrionivorans TaxID=2152716 RepID=A0ABY0IIU0_9BACT|nr:MULTISPECIES: 2Fe-2S iron-sulfur cluster binding domain-containing protein [Halobacteriovorax]AYF45813.1 2Fe-2S iron-sulfur cluster-binding domain protein [Halobacteriovorax sp. BALOs_7]RZF22853.1 2Fe-2S iron-sulfur cluster binding domain-containing protein [Halobacteriovorax vibrionivorans]TGD47354.1 2Fe-2S iron-sulfur cluster binding domain-containing protein [Halobacteriovorax sp. Y22]
MHKASLIDENGQSTEFTIDENQSIFDALQDQGKTLPHGCLSGSCGSCRIQIIEGKENMKKPGIIEQNTIDAIAGEHPEVEEGKIRMACRAKVLGDIKFSSLK